MQAIPASNTSTIRITGFRHEAANLIEAGVCSAEDVDAAIVNGTGNAVGPMTVAKS